MAFIGSSSNSAISAGSVPVDAPAGILDNHMLVLFVHTYGASGAAATCTGFAQVAHRSVTGDDDDMTVLVKRAASEYGYYTVASTAGCDIEAWIGAYSGRITSGTALEAVDVYSDTLYQTSNTTVRAAGMTIVTAGSDVIWGGFCWASPLTLTKPTAITLRDSEVGSSVLTCGDLLNQSAGATGNQDGTAGGATASNKHAMMLALKPTGGEPPAPSTKYVMVRKT